MSGIRKAKDAHIVYIIWPTSHKHGSWTI